MSAVAQRVKSQVAYFSMDPHNELVRKHSQQGGLAAVYEQGYLSILKGDWLLRIEQAEKVPLTMGGKAPFQIANALAASLAAFAQGVDIGYIRQALHTFEASTDQTPGRMNLFNLGRFHALVDYAHNPASYEALGGFVKNWPGQRIGVVGGPGDRRDDDFIALGRLAAQMFDDIVVKEDDDTRGRERGEAAKWIVHGIEESPGSANYRTILDETEAVNTALDAAPDGGLVVILPESVNRAIALIKARNPLPQPVNGLNGSAALVAQPSDQYAEVHP